MTARWCWLASAISFLISSELLALPVNTSTIERAERIALTISSWKFSPGPMSREACQHARPRCFSASQTRAAILRSCDEWLIKTNGCIAAAADASIEGRFTATIRPMPARPGLAFARMAFDSSAERPALAGDEFGEGVLGLRAPQNMVCVVALLGKLLLNALPLLRHQQRLDAQHRVAVVAGDRLG